LNIDVSFALLLPSGREGTFGAERPPLVVGNWGFNFTVDDFRADLAGPFGDYQIAAQRERDDVLLAERRL